MMGHYCIQNIEQVQKQELSLKQWQAIEQRQTARLSQSLALRNALLEALYGEKYDPKAQCPECGTHLENVDILRGFSNDPLDYTTQCPKCDHRFLSKLVMSRGATRAELRFLCATQVRWALTNNLAEMKPEELKEDNPSVYQSALIHFGSLKHAFALENIVYDQEVLTWRNKVRDFLGTMPDTIIAECVNVSPSTIRRMRVKEGIATFKKKNSD